jgi:geranylgeranylglycerol-phosphate geranylgeranyltransferase
MLISISLTLEAFLLVVVNVGIMVSYEFKLKKSGFPGNIVIGWLTATIFLFGGLSVYEDIPQLMRISTLALLAFTATLGREIAKDIEDIKGDVDRKTLPKLIGVRGAGALVVLIFIGTALLSIMPLWLGLFEYLYIPTILPADVIFIYCGFVVFENPRLTSGLAKIGMIMALVAFVAGGMIV